ncbi:MAG: hypothetical protein KF723_22945 [Rhizobiaceae bacterium]|nr:hypothetical protein [Rhizobiaceae bacterium]
MSEKIRSMVRVSSIAYPGSAGPKRHQTFRHATIASMAAVLTAGYFNDWRSTLQPGDLVDVVSGLGGVPQKFTVLILTVPASGNVTIDVDSEIGGGVSREIVPTADGLTTGLILATDRFITLASAGANDIATLPAIATVPIGHRIVGKNGGTACELRTPATSGTKINNGAADSNEAVIAANVSVFIEKTAADNWSVITATGGAIAAPTPD